MTSLILFRGTGFGQVDQARSSRAKTKPGQDAGRTSSAATRPTEDAPRRRFAAARAESGSTDRTPVPGRNLCSPKAKTHATVDLTGQNGKVFDTTPVVANSCKAHGKKSKQHSERGGGS
jgi:hypothetical protein